LVRLVLAGPDPSSIQDDPEAHEVLAEIRDAYAALSTDLQEAIAVLLLPMSSPDQNALIVNALQRCSDIIVQNSLREGFGLTVTEAMWKQAAVAGSSAAGLRQQIRPELDGCLLEDPEDRSEVARTLAALLRDQRRREAFGRSAQQRVHAQCSGDRWDCDGRRALYSRLALRATWRRRLLLDDLLKPEWPSGRRRFRTGAQVSAAP
ncbi:MAG TPA: glycosyltransferase, partial [Wenzhouxiangella sp.]|nr:glycosyltransferase [Wenzhouxiangella sp.]